MRPTETRSAGSRSPRPLSGNPAGRGCRAGGVAAWAFSDRAHLVTKIIPRISRARPVRLKRGQSPGSNALHRAAGQLTPGATAASGRGKGLVVAMQIRKQDLVDTLRSAGFSQVADEAMQVLPDPVDREQLLEWLERQGISRDQIISWMGGSP